MFLVDADVAHSRGTDWESVHDMNYSFSFWTRLAAMISSDSPQAKAANFNPYQAVRRTAKAAFL